MAGIQIGIGLNPVSGRYTNALSEGGGTVPHALDPLFANEELGFILDPHAMSTMWQDTAKTIPVAADGDRVAVWEDARGNGISFSVTDDARRPTWREGAGKPYVDFHGNHQLIRNATDLNFPVVGAHAHITSSNSGAVVYMHPHDDANTAPYARTGILHTIYGQAGILWNGTARATAASVLNGSAFRRISSCHSTGKLYTDGVAETFPAVAAITYPNNQGVIIGTNATFGSRYRGKLYGLVLYNRAVTPDDLALLAGWNLAA